MYLRPVKAELSGGWPTLCPALVRRAQERAFGLGPPTIPARTQSSDDLLNEAYGVPLSVVLRCEGVHVGRFLAITSIEYLALSTA